MAQVVEPNVWQPENLESQGKEAIEVSRIDRRAAGRRANQTVLLPKRSGPLPLLLQQLLLVGEYSALGFRHLDRAHLRRWSRSGAGGGAGHGGQVRIVL